VRWPVFSIVVRRRQSEQPNRQCPFTDECGRKINKKTPAILALQRGGTSAICLVITAVLMARFLLREALNKIAANQMGPCERRR
jgi:hypothetical protein